MSEDAPRAPFEPGERFERSLSLSAEDIRTFATLVGDTNPLHHDEELAKRSRFGALIASGTQTSALMGAATAALVTDRAPSLGLEVSFRFHRVVKADEQLRIVWEVVSVEPSPKLGGHIVTLDGRMTDAQDRVSVAGQVKTLVMTPPEGR